ncbi:hypothetical protein OG785_37745 [Streptomyces sp. NBC_00006]|uniref:hypothetical protein n=1 Tax=unclassified Streptomyces TaxID=2593676 RepID=UPI00225BE62F|nr:MULTISPECIES: hypothetical protein [unclassified Streptomyces]MCX5536289.1 hypothetical protein [Streptomyces sp. NBC_00006]
MNRRSFSALMAACAAGGVLGPLLGCSRSDGLDTGGGDKIHASLHTGTTAWFTLAARRANPLVVTR